MSIKDRADAAAQNVEGKGQEVIGKVTGNSEDEATGKAKQAVANVRDGMADAKDKIADKANEVAGNVRDGIEHAKDKIADKANEVAGNVRNQSEQAKNELNK